MMSLCLRLQGSIYSGGGGRMGRRASFPPKVSPEKSLKLFQILIIFDDVIRESVKATNVQKCNFSQS